MDYTEEIYKLFFRTLVKEIAEKYPDNSDATLESEVEYIQKRLEDERLDWLFKGIMNKETFYQLIYDKSEDINDYKRRREDFSKVNFSSIRENNKDNKDIVWTLQRTGAKYPKGNIQVSDRNGYKNFEQLLEELGFSDMEKQFFYYSDTSLYFNALTDNGEKMYSQQHQLFLSHNGFLANNDNSDKCLFLNALEKSNLQIMHEKLQNLIKLYSEIKCSKSIWEVYVQKIIKLAEYLSDLVPIIDKKSNLKSEEQLKEEWVTVRFAVFKFFMQSKHNNEESENNCLKDILVKYFENHALIKWLLEGIYKTGNLNNEQILVITEGYLDSLENHFNFFKNKVIQYQKVCEKFQGNQNPIQMYKDMWEEVWNDYPENE